MQVTASDGDKDRPQNIVYFLTGQGIDPDNPANSKFDINRTTGEIFVLKVSAIRVFSSPKNKFITKSWATLKHRIDITVKRMQGIHHRDHRYSKRREKIWWMYAMRIFLNMAKKDFNGNSS